MNDIQVIHYRNNSENNPQGGVTIAYTEKHGVVRFALAVCHPDQNYSKKEGFALAKARLELSYTFPTSKGVVEFDTNKSIREMVDADINHLTNKYARLVKHDAVKAKTNHDAMAGWYSVYLSIQANKAFLESMIVKKVIDTFQGNHPYLR